MKPRRHEGRAPPFLPDLDGHHLTDEGAVQRVEKEYAARFRHPVDFADHFGQGRMEPVQPERPLSDKVVWNACHEAALRAGLTKRIGPHMLRHASAYYTTFQRAFILKVIALGQAQSAAVYGRYV
jgi:integrase